MATIRLPSVIDMLALAVAFAALGLAIKTDATVNRTSKGLTAAFHTIAATERELRELRADLVKLQQLTLGAYDGLREFASRPVPVLACTPTDITPAKEK